MCWELTKRVCICCLCSSHNNSFRKATLCAPIWRRGIWSTECLSCLQNPTRLVMTAFWIWPPVCLVCDCACWHYSAHITCSQLNATQPDVSCPLRIVSQPQEVCILLWMPYESLYMVHRKALKSLARWLRTLHPIDLGYKHWLSDWLVVTHV